MLTREFVLASECSPRRSQRTHAGPSTEVALKQASLQQVSSLTTEVAVLVARLLMCSNGAAVLTSEVAISAPVHIFSTLGGSGPAGRHLEHLQQLAACNSAGAANVQRGCAGRLSLRSSQNAWRTNTSQGLHAACAAHLQAGLDAATKCFLVR